ncbi:MAG: efflux RND transporter periplasmic adaptor subunit [Clostridiales bacterium]|nr:efflux RND transporter periplasmic adaptor subunit [Clostridiales bacterium]
MSKIKGNKIVLGVATIIMIFGLSKTMANSFTDKGMNDAIYEQGVVTELLTLEKMTLIDDRMFIGTVESESTASISSKIASNVLRIHVSEGDMVKQGDVLITMDNSLYQAKKETVLMQKNTLVGQESYLNNKIHYFYDEDALVSKLNALMESLIFQKTNLENSKILYEAGAISKVALDQEELKYTMLQYQVDELNATIAAVYDQLINEKIAINNRMAEINAVLNELEVSLSETIIKAPFDGKISYMFVEEGDMSMTGKTLLKIDKIGTQKIIVYVGETDLMKLQENMVAEIYLTNDDEKYKGKVAFISTNIDPRTRMGFIEVSFDESPIDSVLGASASIKIILNSQDNQIIIPVDAVKQLSEKEVVYVNSMNGYVEERKIILGGKNNGYYQVLSGLEAGEEIAIKNLDQLYNDAKIYDIDLEVE